MDEVIGVSEINGGIDMDFMHSGKEVGNEQKGISVFFGYFIETLEIYTEAEGFIFLDTVLRIGIMCVKILLRVLLIPGIERHSVLMGV